MSWDVCLNPVADELAASPTLRDQDVIEQIIDRAGLRRERFRTSRRSDVSWHEVLALASDGGREQIDAVLNEAIRQSAGPRLEEVVRRYRECRARAD